MARCRLHRHRYNVLAMALRHPVLFARIGAPKPSPAEAAWIYAGEQR